MTTPRRETELLQRWLHAQARLDRALARDAGPEEISRLRSGVIATRSRYHKARFNRARSAGASASPEEPSTERDDPAAS